METPYVPYRAFAVLENNPGQYCIVKRKYTNTCSFPSGGGTSMDTTKIDAALRELEEETGIRKEQIEIIKTVTLREAGSRDIFILVARMKIIDKHPGWISHDEDIEYYTWMSLDEISVKQMTVHDDRVLKYVQETLLVA